LTTRTITLRRDKGAMLTHDEMDDNFARLESLALPPALGVGSYLLGTLKNLGNYDVGQHVSASEIQPVFLLSLSSNWPNVVRSITESPILGTWRNMGPHRLRRTDTFTYYCLLMRVA